MALPVSTSWTLFDFNSTGTPENINQILAYGEVTANRGGSYVYIDGDGDLHLMSDDSAESSVEIDVAVPQNNTIEFDVKPVSLPPDLNSLDVSRFFVAIYDKQDNTAGLVFSQSGLAWVSSLSGVVSVTGIPGSAGIIQAGTWYTVRVVLRGDYDTMYVYITPRASIATTGHILRYTTSALETPSGQIDAVRFEVYGTAADVTEIKFESARLSETINVPNQPPIARPGDDLQVLAGTYAKLDGRESSDPEGADLTYEWRIISAPSDSSFVSTGTQGWTPSEADPDAVTHTFNDTQGFSTLSLLQAGDVLVVGSIVAEIASSSFNPDGSLVDPQSLTLTTASLDENQTNLGWTIIHQQIIGSPTAALTYVETDVDGLYVADLVVNDGGLDSQAAELLIQAVDTSLTRAVIPDLSYIWKCIGDEWSFIDDREKIETIWEAFALVAAGYLFWGWQAQECSSLGTIPRTVARKWVPLGTQVPKDNWGVVEWKHLYPTILGSDISVGAAVSGETLDIRLRGTTYHITFTGADPIPSSSVIQQINAALPLQIAASSNGHLALQADEYFTILASSAAATLGFSASTDTDSVLQGTQATPKVPADIIAGVNEAAANYTSHFGDVSKDYHATDDSTNGLTQGSPLSADAIPSQVVALWNDIVTQFDAHDANTGGAYHTTGSLHQTSLTLAVSIDDVVLQYSKYKIAFDTHIADSAEHTGGDAPDTDNPLTKTIVGSSAQDELRTIVLSDVVDLTQSGQSLQGFLFYADDGTSAGSVYRIDRAVSATKILLREPLPELATYNWSILPMVRLPDLDASELRVNEYDQLEISFTPDDDVSASDVVQATCSGGRGEYVAFNPNAWSQYTGLVELERIIKCQYLPVYQEVTSIPYLQRKIENAAPLRENKDYMVNTYDGNRWVEFFAPSDDPPENWWAEYMMFDNSPTIDANFGYLIGFHRDDVTDIDYLSAVQALYYSYWNGPVVDALRLGLQVIFGLPMAEAAGTIIDIDTFYSQELGRILIEDADGTGTVRTYYYNRLASIATNPATDVAYVVGDEVERFAILCTGVEVLDYLTDDHWFTNDLAQGIFHEIEKYHTFYVAANVDVFDLSNMAIAHSFLTRAKEARTKYVLVPWKGVSSEIDITDQIEQEIVEYLYDNLRSLGDGGVRMFDDSDASGNWRQQFDSNDEENIWGFDTTLHDGWRDGPHDSADDSISAHDPPHVVTNDLSSLTISDLNTKTLNLQIGNGLQNPHLIAVARYNQPTDLSFDFLLSGSLTPSAAGGAAADTSSPWAGRGCLDMPGGASQPVLTYSGSGLSSLVDEGTILFQIKPGYSGTPTATSRTFWKSEGTTPLDNLIQIQHKTGTGLLECSIYDSSGVLIVTLATAAAWNPTAGQWYEIGVVFNNVAGYQGLLIDGVIQATGSATGTRDSDTISLIIGESGVAAGDFAIDNIRAYDIVLHDDAYTPAVVEAYYDPGEIEVTFSGLTGGSVLQDVVDQINAAVRNTDTTYTAANPDIGPAHVWDVGGSRILLKSWNTYIKIVGGTAVPGLGLVAGFDATKLELPDPHLLVHASFDGTKDILITRLNRLRSNYENHRQDEPGDYDPTLGTPTYHALEDMTNAAPTPLATTATDGEVVTFVNSFKTAYNNHDNDNGGAYHGGGGSHQEATANATDLNTAAHLLTALELTYHEHIHDTTAYHASEDLDNVFETYGLTHLDLTYVRDDGDPTATITGTPSILTTAPKYGNGCLRLAGGANNLIFDGAGLIDDIWHAGTIRFYYRPTYSGAPASDNYIFSLQNTAGDTSNQVVLAHSAAGNLAALFRDDSNAIVATTSVAWSPNANQWYHIEVTFDFIAGYQAIRVDGAITGSASIIAVRTGGQEYLMIGSAGTAYGDIDDFAIYSSVLAWNDFTPPEEPVRPIPGLRKEELYLDANVIGTQTEDFDNEGPASDVIVIGHYDVIGVDKFNLDYVRDSGSDVATPTGSPDIIFGVGVLELQDPTTPAPAVESLQYSGANIVDAMIDSGCIEFKLTPLYSGTPSATQYFVAIGASAGSTNNGIEIYHAAGTGNLTVIVYNSAGAVLDTISAVWNPTAGTEYHIEYDYLANPSSPVSRIFVNGAVHAATTGFATGNRSGTAQLLRVGDDVAGTGNANYYKLRELVIYDALQHSSTFTPPTEPIRHGYFTRFDSIYSNGLVDTLQLDQELTGTQTTTRILR